MQWQQYDLQHLSAQTRCINIEHDSINEKYVLNCAVPNRNIQKS